MRVVNCFKEECDFYCGRKSSFHKAMGSPYDLSILGNPEPLKSEEDRENNLKRYAKHLFRICNEDPDYRLILKSLPDDTVLGCFCAPKKCHCDIIIEASIYYKQK
jgi:hypothetical protein